MKNNSILHADKISLLVLFFYKYWASVLSTSTKVLDPNPGSYMYL